MWFFPVAKLLLSVSVVLQWGQNKLPDGAKHHNFALQCLSAGSCCLFIIHIADSERQHHKYDIDSVMYPQCFLLPYWSPGSGL